MADSELADAVALGGLATLEGQLLDVSQYVLSAMRFSVLSIARNPAFSPSLASECQQLAERWSEACSRLTTCNGGHVLGATLGAFAGATEAYVAAVREFGLALLTAADVAGRRESCPSWRVTSTLT